MTTPSPTPPTPSSGAQHDGIGTRVGRLLRMPAAKLADVRFMAQLFPVADAHAARLGDGPTGAEHLLLAALEMEDGSARRAFEAAGLRPDAFEPALAAQHRQAIASFGGDELADLDARLDDSVAATARTSRGPISSAPSARDLFREVVERLRAERSQLVGAWFVLVAAEHSIGTLRRTLDTMGADRAALAAAARAEIDAIDT